MFDILFFVIWDFWGVVGGEGFRKTRKRRKKVGDAYATGRQRKIKGSANQYQGSQTGIKRARRYARR